MQFAKDTKNSFFDSLGCKFDFENMKPGSKPPKELASLPMIIGPLTCKEVGSTNLKQGIFGLHKNLLTYYGNKVSKAPKAILNLNHVRLNPLTTSSRHENSSNGVVLARNNKSFEVYFPDKEMAGKWKSALRRVCVLSSFHEDYNAKKLIGKGSFARVYVAESKVDGLCYAAKTFTKTVVDTPDNRRFKAMLLNEIEIMRALEHENIIKLYEVHETEKTIYLIIELVQGKPLEDVLKRHGDLSEEKSKDIARSILSVATYLASKGIMHRDLKPSNILIERGGKVKVVDFGLATYIGAADYIFKKCGTPGYIAPEVFNMKDNCQGAPYDDRCDSFSIGCIMYQLLFGVPLFHDANIENVLRLNKKFTELTVIGTVKKELNDIHSKINKEGLNLLLKLLEYDPKKRISSKDALYHAYFNQVPDIRIKLLPSGEISDPAVTLSKVSRAESFISPSNVITSLEKQKTQPLISRGELSPKMFGGDRYAEKDSFCFDVGKTEINGNLKTLSNGSTVNSIVIKSTSNPSSPRISSNFSGSKHLLQMKGRGQSQSFKVTSPDNKHRSVLKAAIFQNIKLHNTGVNDEDAFGELTPGFSPKRRLNSEENFRKASTERIGWDTYRDDDDSGEVGTDGDEGCHVQMTVERFQRAISRKHSSKMLKAPDFKRNYGHKSAR